MALVLRSSRAPFERIVGWEMVKALDAGLIPAVPHDDQATVFADVIVGRRVAPSHHESDATAELDQRR